MNKTFAQNHALNAKINCTDTNIVCKSIIDNVCETIRKNECIWTDDFLHVSVEMTMITHETLWDFKQFCGKDGIYKLKTNYFVPLLNEFKHIGFNLKSCRKSPITNIITIALDVI